MTRREFLPTFAAAAAQNPSAMEFDDALVKRHDSYVDTLLSRQETAPTHPMRGALPDAYGIYFAGSPAGLIDACLAALNCRQSRHHASGDLMARIRLAASWLAANQHSSGNFDLPITNFNSPPDTAFLTHSLGAAALLARAGGQNEVSSLVEPTLKKIGGALEAGGVHTPNHRWVVCEALAQLWELFGEPGYVRRINQWLAESIDIDADGQFHERSTTIYNAVTDRAFLVMAVKLKRPELLDPVRKNLAAMLYLLHDGGEVVTEVSTRQDAFERGDMSRYWFPLRFMAVHDSDGRLATLATRHSQSASLSLSMIYPELRAPLPAETPLPDDFVREMNAIKVARVRRKRRSATVIWSGINRFFTFRNGSAVLEGLRFASAFFGKGQFMPAEMEKSGGGWRMSQSLEGPYYQPFTPPRVVGLGQYDITRALRQKSEICRITQSATVREVNNGFEIDIAADGTANVPLAIELIFREGALITGATPGATPSTYLLKSGHAIAKSGADSIRFGPGLGLHSWTQIRGAAPRPAGVSVYLCGFTPFKHTLRIEAGAA